MTKEELEKKMTAKQLKFCQEYMKDFNGTQSYHRAGYKARTNNVAQVEAFKLLLNPKIKAYVIILKEEAEKRFWEYDMEFVVKNAMEILNRCMQHKEVIDREGNAVLTQTPAGKLAAAYVFEAKTALSTLEFLARLKGYDKTKGDGDDNSIHIHLTNYLHQNNQFNKYFPVTKETEHIAKLLGKE